MVKPKYSTYLYYIKGKNLWQVPRKGKRGHKKKIENNVISKRAKGYLYYVKRDRSGHLKPHKAKMKNS